MKHANFNQACRNMGVSVVSRNRNKTLLTCPLARGDHSFVFFKSGTLTPKYVPHLLALSVPKEEVDVIQAEELEELLEFHLFRKALNPHYWVAKTLKLTNSKPSPPKLWSP